MIDFNIDINKKTPHLLLLKSLNQQSEALRTIHNPKTWCLSALTYALHLNDCLVLFEDLKRRWQRELPFAEAWDVDFRKWKSDIWTAVNNVQYNLDDSWKSLCDTDYARFIELSNKVADGKITIASLMAFLEGKESCIAKIIIDAGNRLSSLFVDIESTINNSSAELYQTFYDGCVESYKELHKDDLYIIRNKNYELPYDTWAASKTLKKRPEAIEKQMEYIVKDIEKNKSLAEVWSECYEMETKNIDTESIARNLFINRTNIISNEQYSYKDSLDKLFYAVTMLEFLQERLSELSCDGKQLQTPEQVERKLKNENKIFRTHKNGHEINYSNLIVFLKEQIVSTLTYKNEWTAIFLFVRDKGLLQEERLESFEQQMNQPEWFGWVADRKKCSADAIGDYSYLFNIPRQKWYDDNIIPAGSKATSMGMARIVRDYNTLDTEYNDSLICK